MDSTQISNIVPQAVRISDAIQPLRLRERQVTHYKRICEILDNFFFYVDGSEMGSGKSIIAGAIAITRKLPVVIFCPKSARQNWYNTCAMYGISVYDLETGGVITYDTLRSTKGHQPRHNLLRRDDTGEVTQFYATTLFIQLVKAGVLVIFDEFQKLKNKSDQYYAAKALMSHFYTIKSNSRVAFLSGTTMDKPEHTKNFMQLVGFIERRNLYTKIRGQIRLEGVDDLKTWARRIDSNALESFLLSHPFRSTRKGAENYIFELFIEVIKPGIMSIMPSLQLDKNIKNGYYRLESTNEEKYKQAISNLKIVTRYDDETKTIVQSKENMGAITKALINLQNAKKNIMFRKAKEDLTRNPNCKVILYADYYEVIDYLLESLAEFNPLELTGRISEDRRNENIAHFQEPNANYRLIIGNPLVGGMCINLHDVTGHYPRFTYIMPGFRTNELHQCTGRVVRDSMVGTATIRFVYGLAGDTLESNILTCNYRKGNVLELIHHEQDACFPNQYESSFET